MTDKLTPRRSFPASGGPCLFVRLGVPGNVVLSECSHYDVRNIVVMCTLDTASESGLKGAARAWPHA